MFFAGAANYFRPIATMAATQSVDTLSHEGANIAWPSGVASAVGASGYGVLASNSSRDTQLPTASIAKLITALIVLQKHPIAAGSQGDKITFTDKDVKMYNDYIAVDGSVAKVAAGEQLTEYQALQALLIPSANNIADSLAIWTFGSLSAYSEYANQYVKTLGMNDTTVGTDASGFAPSTLSTPSDLVRLGIAAENNPVIADIASQSSATLPVAGVVRNSNHYLGKNGVIGLKTGNSDQAGGVYVFAAKYDPGNGKNITIVGSVMGAKTLTIAENDGAQLLASAKQNFVSQTVVQTGQIFGSYQTIWDTNKISVEAGSSAKAIIWKGSSLIAKINAKSIARPMQAGDTIGTVTITTVGDKITVPLVLQNSVATPSFWWRLTRINLP